MRREPVESAAAIPLGVFRLPYSTKINWDPVKDITYIIGITGYAFGIVAPSDSPIKTWADFVAYAKANPGKGSADPARSCSRRVWTAASAVRARCRRPPVCCR